MFTVCTCCACRPVGDIDSDPVQLLYGAVLASGVHAASATQVSILRHQPGPTVLRLLSVVRHHIHAAARVRRTHRRRSVSLSAESTSHSRDVYPIGL